ncbi:MULTISPECIES: Tox-REase-5 domain-containing protein [unclassified Curtobacterium]|uniref:Tox-REase-5 domain-containing protein n=1 Tax=unclassified Curtobacterium TaxID=257496 RepID=UPI00380D06B0
MSGLVKVGEIPYTDVDLSGITAGAGNLRTVASAVRDGSADIHSAWTPISQSYEGPADQQLFDAMNPIVPQGTAFGDDLDTVAKALDDFVTEVTPIVAKLKTYVTRGNQLHADVKQHDGAWDEDETLNGENNDIINGVANQVVAYQAAERTCANTIRGLSGLAALHAMTGDDPDDELGYGYKELPMGTELPWGTAEARKESCGEKTLYFVPHLLQGVVVDGIWGTVQGLGQLVGIDGTGWHLDTLTSAWKGMGSLIGYSAADDSWSWGNAGEAWKGLGKATVGWDAWADDPGRAAGQAVWGIGSLLIPVAGEVGKVGALGKVGEVAGTVGKAGKFLDLVDAGAWASKGLTSVLPKLGDLKGLVSSGLGDMSGFTGKIADFKTGLGDFLHGHHGSDAEVPPVRSEPSVEAPANAHNGGSTVEAPPVREPELVGAGGHGESGTATEHGGGSDSGSGSGSGSSGGHGHGGDSGSSGGSGHGTDAEHDGGTGHGSDADGSATGHGSDGDGAGTGHGSDADGGIGGHDAGTSDGPGHAPSAGDDTAPTPAGGEHNPAPEPRPVPKADEFDASRGDQYDSGDPLRPGDPHPHVPAETYNQASHESGWKYFGRQDHEWADYQAQIAGVERTADGKLPEYRQFTEDGATVDFDGMTERGHPPQEVFLDAKAFNRGIAFADPSSPYWSKRIPKMIEQAEAQIAALPDGARLEWHVKDPYAADAVRRLLRSAGIDGDDLAVIFTPLRTE